MTSSGSLDVKPEFSPGLGEAAIVILVLMLSAPKKHIVMFLESILEIEGRDHLAALLLQFFRVSASILNNEAFPKNWLNVNILAHRVLLKMLDPVATMFEFRFGEGRCARCVVGLDDTADTCDVLSAARSPFPPLPLFSSPFDMNNNTRPSLYLAPSVNTTT